MIKAAFSLVLLASALTLPGVAYACGVFERQDKEPYSTYLSRYKAHIDQVRVANREAIDQALARKDARLQEIFVGDLPPGRYYTKRPLSVYLTPSVRGLVVNNLSAHQRVTVLDRSGGWAKISRHYEGERPVEGVPSSIGRWVPASYLWRDESGASIASTSTSSPVCWMPPT